MNSAVTLSSGQLGIFYALSYKNKITIVYAQLLYLYIIVIATLCICKLLALIYEERYPIRTIKIAHFILKGS